MTDAHIIAGDLTANHEERVVSGLLLPYGEVGHTNIGMFSIDRPGIITIPGDISVLNANEDHDQLQPRARFLTATESPAGVYASFRIGRNPADDALLARIEKAKQAGKPMRLSAEVRGVGIRNGKATCGELTGAAFVERGAFESAALMAAAVDTDPEETPAEPEAPAAGEPVVTTEKFSDEFTDEQGVTRKRTTTRTTTVDGETTTITEKTVIEEPETPAEEEPTVTNAAVAPGLFNAAPAAPAAPKQDKNALFAAIAHAVQTGDTGNLLAAFKDVKIDGTGAVGTGVVVPEYVGQVWDGRTYQRRIIPLTGAGAPLTKLVSKGWRFKVKPEVDEWAGNKADVPSNTPTTEEVTFTTTRFAGGWDFAREFWDFGELEVIESFLRLAADSYAMKSDNKHLANLVAAAQTAAVGTIPTGVGSGIAKVVRGALRVITAEAIPSYAVVAPDVFEQIMFTKKDDVLAFLSMSLGLEDGQTENFKIVPHAQMATGTVLVGAKEAAQARELGGAPIRVSAIDIARGGNDEALFGYLQTRVEYPKALQLVTN
ncbi:hypothetical protein ALI44B_04600 [Leifsonia sp. ALI-44-B]|uniref:phage major capsid protein n=1 Tax=Leifsonia sp. ALI-44-B TaxID=1933776 RepID=UPI00097C289B|nr:hypothetical protein [Leifsonia sp. ALI-44-B]ONI63910.1 hypothetical protein ALI44B_04600 [Leifsonia sp. ALI-44-B]